jgi:deoxyribonuclease-4
MTIKVGPAGLGPVATAEKILEQYHKLGFKACELAFTYGPYIKSKEDAERIGKRAKELGISLSIHAQYWVNLNSDEKEKISASKERILECCKVAEWLQAKTVVFHPGYYSNKGKTEEDREKSYEVIKEGIMEMMKRIKDNKWKVQIAPETMGKVNVFGSIEEISSLVKETGCSFCIDFAHILARNKSVDYKKIISLFPGKEWHCHFSGIIYGDLGEKSHKPTEKSEWKSLFANLPKDKEITIVNESPSMVDDCIDAVKMLKD